MNAIANKFKYEQTAVFMLIMSVVAGGFNYLFQILAGRFLPAADYGVLNACFSIISVVSVIGVALGMSIAKHLSATPEQIGATINRILVVGGYAAAPFVAVVFVLMILFGYQKNISISTAVAAYAVSLSYVFYGALQGSQLFKQVSIFNTIMPFSKVLLGTAFLLVYKSIWIALFAITVGSFFSMIYGFAVLRKSHSFATVAPYKTTAPVFKYLVYTLISTATLTLFTNMDILLVRQYFSEEELGIYSCAALLGKIILYIPTVLTTMMFPVVAQKKQNAKSELLKTIGYSFLISATAAVVLYVLRNYIIRLLMGDAFAPAGNYILPLIGAILPLALVTVTVNYLIARSDKWFVSVICIIGIIGILAATAVCHASITSMIVCIAVVFLILFIVLLMRGILIDER